MKKKLLYNLFICALLCGCSSNTEKQLDELDNTLNENKESTSVISNEETTEAQNSNDSVSLNIATEFDNNYTYQLGDTLTGTIVERQTTPGSHGTGDDGLYYVMVFDEPIDIIAYDSNSEKEILLEDYKEIPLYSYDIIYSQYKNCYVQCPIYVTIDDVWGLAANTGEITIISGEMQEIPTQSEASIDSFDWTSGTLLINGQLFSIGESVNDWIDKGLYVLPNTTSYKNCIVLGLDEETPLCRVYIEDNGGISINDSTITSAWFGILWDSRITDSRAKSVLENPAPVEGAGGVYIGLSYSDLVTRLGEPDSLEETSCNTIVTAHYYTDDIAYYIDIDRNTEQVCGFAYGTGSAPR